MPPLTTFPPPLRLAHDCSLCSTPSTNKQQPLRIFLSAPPTTTTTPTPTPTPVPVHATLHFCPSNISDLRAFEPSAPLGLRRNTEPTTTIHGPAPLLLLAKQVIDWTIPLLLLFLSRLRSSPPRHSAKQETARRHMPCPLRGKPITSMSSLLARLSSQNTRATALPAKFTHSFTYCPCHGVPSGPPSR
ncbi:hypothetical protein BKA80DRAFT_89046 [Phyllosticta citrichinensis]